jgi:hypothetical protein
MELDHNWTRFELNGVTYAAKLERDEYHGAPWDEECGHGDVTGWERREKAPGEMVLCEDRHAKRFYDFAGAVKRAKAEGWNAAPFYPPGEETKGQRAHKAALADYNRLRAWCNDDWCYVGVIVAPICPCCDEVKDDEAQSLWAIESDAGEYLFEVAQELAAELAPSLAA